MVLVWIQPKVSEPSESSATLSLTLLQRSKLLCKGQRVDILGSLGNVVSIVATQVCLCSTKAESLSKWAWLELIPKLGFDPHAVKLKLKAF